MNNRYYTPDIEVLHVNYICELYNRMSGVWEITSLTGYDIRELYMIIPKLLSTAIRTKYLTKEDIEECGWKYIEELTEGEYIGYKATRKRGLYPETLTLIWWSNNKLKISSSHLDVVYWGECKSINELWKIQKWLEIMPYKTTDNGQQSEKDKLSK